MVRVRRRAWLPLKVLACGLLYMIATFFGGSLLLPLAPEGTLDMDPSDALELIALQVPAGLLIAVAVAAAASALGGRYLSRGVILAFLLYGAHAVAGAIEARLYTTNEGIPYMLAVAVLPSIVCAMAAGFLLGPPDDGVTFPKRLAAHFRERPGLGWAWRLPVAAIAFAVVYLVFGLMAAPFELAFYRESPDLRIPSMPALLQAQVARSVILLVVVLPLLVAWRGTRRRLWLALGTALFIFTGLVGLLQPGPFPVTIRIVHGVATLGSSFVYAGAIVLLLGRRSAPVLEEGS